MKQYDVIVVGAGALGLASTYFLSRVGLRVLCIDRFSFLHSLSSSTGASRLFRQAYFEDERYIPLLKRALALWRELEHQSGVPLLQQNGFLVMSDSANSTSQKIQHNAALFDIPIDILTSKQIHQRYPAFNPPSNFSGYLEKTAGVLNPERALTIFMHQALHHGAQFHEHEQIIEFSSTRNGVTLWSNRDCYNASFAVLAPGPFINDLAHPPMTFTILRAVQFWFYGQVLSLQNAYPCFAFASNDDFIYGFPALDSRGVKIARYASSHVISNPCDTHTYFEPSELAPIADTISKYLPTIDPKCHDHKVCFYSMTNDENFLIDQHLSQPNVIYACGGSGHAFKFAPVIGEIVSQLIQEKPSGFDLDFLKFR